MKVLRWVLLALLVLSIAATILLGWQLIERYPPRILPGITIAGVDVGDMTAAQAETTLNLVLPSLDQRTIKVEANAVQGVFTWTECGISYDFTTALSAAQAVARGMEDRDILMAAIGLETLEKDFPVGYTAADPAKVQSLAQSLAGHVETAPQDAYLIWGETGPSGVMGVNGQHLDADAAASAILAALEQAITADQAHAVLTLDVTPVLPAVLEPEPALSRAQRLLAGPLRVSIYDPILTGDETEPYSATFTADPARLYSWMYADTLPPYIHLRFNQYYVREWVDSIRQQLPGGRTLDVIDIAHRILTGPLQTGEHELAIRVTHPATTYTVDWGDVFYDIAYNHGFPQYQLELANPDVDPGFIDYGQVLTIPSLDTLFPHPHVVGKRIEVNLPTQLLVAYQYDTPIYTFTVSSGISTTPTLAGQFQVLFKEENAFAQRWNLDMPYFMGFYEEGSGFYNGFHELPITQWGTRLRSSVLGYPASFGCIILDEGDAQTLYDWAPVGTYVRVTGVAPGTPFGRETLADIAPLEGVDD